MTNLNIKYFTICFCALSLVQGCKFQSAADPQDAGASAAKAQSTPQAYVDTNEGMLEAKAVDVVQVVNSEEILTNLISISGLEIASEKSTSEYKSWRTLYSDSGDADAVNAPMWLGIVNISGGVCSDLVAQESKLASNSRRFFNQIDFAKGPDALTDTAINDVVRRLARSAWARNEKPEEVTMIKQALNSFTGTTKEETNLAMLTVCTGIFAALETNIK